MHKNQNKPRDSKATAQIMHRPDYVIAILVLILIAVGLIMLYSIGWITVLKQSGGLSDKNSFFASQIISLALGLVGWFVASRINYNTWRKLATPIFIGTILLMVLVLIPGAGVEVNGATRWVRLGPINFQPVEFLKLGTVLYMATWLEKNRAKLSSPIEGLLPFMLILSLVAVFVVFLQRDMGSATVLMALCLCMFYSSGVALRIFGASVLILTTMSGLMVLLFPYRLARFLTFLNNTQDTTGAGYHINQALIAIGSGGLAGRGLGKSLQAYGYLPESTNDSIFAVIGEQLGLLGCIGITSVVGALIWRALRICRSAPDYFSRMLAIGITAWIGFQALINISAMLGLIPLTGIPMPFVSYGGTSLVALLFGVGILQNISRYSSREVTNAHFALWRRNRRAHRADSSRRSSAHGTS